MENQNIYSDLIFRLIDGELNDAERKSVFSALNKYPELQQEFQSALKINSASRSVVFGNVVPNAVTNSLFAKAGLNYAGSEVAANAAGAGVFGSIKSAFWGKYILPVFGFVMGGLVSFFVFGTNIINQDSEPDSTENITMNNIPMPEFTSIIPDKIIYEENNINGFSSQQKLLSYKEEAVHDKVNNFKNISENNNMIIDIDNLLTFNYNENNQYLDNSIGNEYQPYSNPNYSHIESDNIAANSKFALEVKNSTFWNLPKETVYPSEIAKFHNMDIALYYILNDRLSLGLGLRQETFYVKYNSTGELSQQYIYEQQPNLINFELSARYYPFTFNGLKPFVQLNAGGGQFGYIGRFVLGGKYQLYKNLGFIFSLENAYMSYLHNNNINYAKKIGFNYGINYSF